MGIGKFTAYALLLLVLSKAVLAGPYSLGLEDSNNAFDAPVPGWVGPAGDGKTPLSNSGNEANFLNPVFTSWADEVVAYEPALTNLDQFWQFSGEALGPLHIDYSFPVVSLGDRTLEEIASGAEPGFIELSFEDPIRNVPGADFVVFENALITLSNQGGAGVGGVFAELAFVEVSSDGITWARFPSISLTDSVLGPFGSIDPTLVYNLAGKHINENGNSWGTPFDLSLLALQPEVIAGDIDIDVIKHIRLVDISGDGSQLDSLGNSIYDAYRTTGSGGADIDAIGAIGQARTYDDWDAGRNLTKTADGEGDGIINLLEYAFDLNPDLPDQSLLPQMLIVNGLPELRFRRDVRNTDIVYCVESTTSLTNPDWVEVACAEAFTDPTTSLSAATATIEAISRHTESSLAVWQEVCLTYRALTTMRYFRVVIKTVSES